MFFIFLVAGVAAALFLTRHLAGHADERRVTSTLVVVLTVFFVTSLLTLLGMALWAPNAKALSILVESLSGLSLGALLVHGQVLREFITFSTVVEEEDDEEDDDEDEDDETEQEIAGLEEEIETLESEIENLEGERTEYEESIEEHRATIASAQSDIDSAQAEIDEINAGIGEHNEQIAELRSKIKALQDGTQQSENAATATDAVPPVTSGSTAPGAATTDAPAPNGAQDQPAGSPATGGGTAQAEPAAPAAHAETASDSSTSKLSLVKGEAGRDGASGTTDGAPERSAPGAGENKQ